MQPTVGTASLLYRQIQWSERSGANRTKNRRWRDGEKGAKTEFGQISEILYGGETQEESVLKLRDREPEIQERKSEVRQIGIKKWGGGVLQDDYESGSYLRYVCIEY